MSTRGGQHGQHGAEGQADEPPRRKRKSRKGEEKPLVAPAPPPPADTRAQRVLYVGCEGESTEPDYLNYLNERFGDGSLTGGRRFKIQPVYTKNGYTPARAVAAVQSRAGEDEAWALFDRDEHHDIADAVKLAAEQGTEVCFSHPSFELWLLLHFQDFGGRLQREERRRDRRAEEGRPGFWEVRYQEQQERQGQAPHGAGREGGGCSGPGTAHGQAVRARQVRGQVHPQRPLPVGRLPPSAPIH